MQISGILVKHEKIQMFLEIRGSRMRHGKNIAQSLNNIRRKLNFTNFEIFNDFNTVTV